MKTVPDFDGMIAFSAMFGSPYLLMWNFSSVSFAFSRFF
jgi:hypothetical protein